MGPWDFDILVIDGTPSLLRYEASRNLSKNTQRHHLISSIFEPKVEGSDSEALEPISEISAGCFGCKCVLMIEW